MSLDIHLENPHSGSPNFDWNITHNLARMAKEVGVYTALWHPSDLDIKVSGDLIPHLESAYSRLAIFGECYDQFAPANGWGDRKFLFETVYRLLHYAKLHPHCVVTVSR